jgi:GMP synthase (glutamine-hydrolysing)
MVHDEIIPILDFGAQYAQLIARRVREKGVYSQLVRPDISARDLAALKPRGIILSGGPSSVYEPNAPRCDPQIFDLGVPILGIWAGRSNRPRRANSAVQSCPSLGLPPTRWCAACPMRRRFG